ncbi:MAG: phosphatidate cytidylyltransferase [Planctomycetales bacterium]|nr:phosphatidate cytidylyltransferase [Planctomycetales bacterium]
MPSVTPGLVATLAIAYAALLIGSGIRLLFFRFVRDRDNQRLALGRRNSLFVWWVLLIAFSLALIFGSPGLAAFFCIASLLGLREFFRIFEQRSPTVPALRLLLPAVAVVHYSLIFLSAQEWTFWTFPIAVLVLVTGVEVTTSGSRDFLRTAAGCYWAAMLIIFGLSHAVMLVGLPAAPGAASPGSIGWCLFVVLLTEVNDIAQALIGRSLGKHKVTPGLSPGKTQEGCLGGFTVTTCLAMCAAPWLTTLTIDRPVWLGLLISAGAGLTIAVAGFLGDLNMSALKREAGVKDSGTLLPGMGGMIDRIDSLTLAAPAFYYYALSINHL